LASALRATHPDAWESKNYDRLLVHAATAAGIVAGKPVAELEAAWQPGLDAFRAKRRAVLLYPE
jgi:hypothetical protein